MAEEQQAPETGQAPAMGTSTVGAASTPAPGPEPVLAPVHTPASRGSSGWAGWRGVALGILLAVVLVFGLVDLGQYVRRVIMQPNASAPVPVVLHGRGVGQTPTPTAPNLVITPGQLVLGCHDTMAISVANVSEHPLRWQVDAVRGAVALSPRASQSGTLGAGQRVAVLVLAVGQDGPGDVVFSDASGGHVDVWLQVHCR